MKNLLILSIFMLSTSFVFGQNSTVTVIQGACTGYDLALDGVSLTPVSDCEEDLGLQLQTGQDYVLTSVNNQDFLNGISTLDLLFLQRHLSGVEPLDSPLKIIAADFDQDGALSTYDIMELYSLILGITTSTPHQQYHLIGPNDPIPSVDWWDIEADLSQTVITADDVDANGKVNVTVLKLGDLNNSAQ